MVFLLDLDGTLVDTNYLHVEAWAAAFRAVGAQVARWAIHRQIGKGTDQMLPMFVPEPERAERAKAVHSQELGRLADRVDALPGARELVEHLREAGHTLWLATSAQPEEVEARMKTIGAREDVFAGVISSGDVERSKPHPDIFLAGLRAAHCRPEEAMVIGDTVWDLEAAAAAKVRSVAVLTGGAFSIDELRAAGALAVFEDCAEMVAKRFPETI